MSIREFAIATIVLAVFITVECASTHTGAILNQVPWLDEVHTGMLLNEPDAAKFHSALSDECVDANLPVYYQLLRAAHIRSLAAIRTVSLVSTSIALLGIYLLLRATFRPVEAAAGALTAWTTPLVAYHAFQARFYAPWFAAVVWFALSVQWSRKSHAKALAAIAMVLTSILACTLHPLGLPAVALIALAEIRSDKSPLKSRIMRVLPSVAGAIAVACYAPLLVAQRNSFTIKTWLVGNPIRLLYSTYGGVLPGVAASVLVLAMFVSAWLCRRDDARPRDVWLSPLSGISALLLFPLLLFAISLFSQPLLLPRYALVSVAGMSAAAAFAASRMKRTCAIVVCVVLVFESSAELTRRVREARDNDRELSNLVLDIRDHASEPALFESRHQLFPVDWVAPDLRDRCAYVDFSPGPNQLDPVVEGFERDFAKKFQRVFGWPHVMAWETVISQPRFLLVALDDDADRIGKRFAGYHVQRVAAKRFELTRMTPDSDESIFFKFE